MCLGDVGQQGATLAAGRLSEWLVCLISRRASVSVASSSNPWEIWERKGRLLGLFSVSVKAAKKVARWEGVEGSRGKVIGDV